ncbi:acyl-CoA dehydrogenase family protein [Micromonospora sp. DT229]|uniref:acyl-CoA dehydrogenase family protein n=1 Tax=Micromonospora sp. DT229 TaxID=3393430 RepID=UPI003CF70820
MDLTPDPLVDRLARAVRARLTGATGSDAVDALRELGAWTFEAPIAADGLDLGLTCGLIVCTELGQRALPEVYGPAALLIDALAAAGRAEEAKPWALDGEAPVVAGLDRWPDRPRVQARPTTAGWQLTGDLPATGLVPTTGTSGPTTMDADACLPVDVDGAPGLAVVAADVWAAALRGGAPLNQTPAVDVVTGFDLTALVTRARIRQAGYLVGLADGALAAAAQHAARRVQFGKPILEHQAVAFPLARAAVAIRATRVLAARAAWLVDTGHTAGSGSAGDPARLAATQALALAAETALSTIRQAIQTHGARGLSLDTPVHAYHLAVRQAATRLGAPSVLWREAGALRLTAQHGKEGDQHASAGGSAGGDAAGRDRSVSGGVVPVR